MTNFSNCFKIKIVTSKKGERKMKYSRSIFIFSIINLICTFICIKYLPDNVIFGITGNFYASEFISKWANLIIPIAQVICMGIIYFVDVFNRNVPHKYRYLISWVAIAFTTYLMWVLMFLQLENNEIGVPRVLRRVSKGISLVT